MGKKTKKCHFIPKVYLRQWLQAGDSKGKNYLYCYDYKNGVFVNSSYTKKPELGLNDRRFQEEKLYTQVYEDELQTIEDHYNSWLSDIENYYKYTHSRNYADVHEFRNDEIFKDRLIQFNNSCKRMLYFSFVQWIRYKNHQERYVLFSIFKDVLLQAEVEYLHLFCRDFVQLDDRIIGLSFQNDKDIYKYAFGYIDSKKLNILDKLGYQILMDYSISGNFVTSTNPVAPLFDSGEKPYGFIFVLSPHISFRLINRSIFYEKNIEEPFAIACTCAPQDERRMNWTQFINSQEASIISNSKENAIDVFCGVELDLVKELQDDVAQKKNELWLQLNNNMKLLDLPKEDIHY